MDESPVETTNTESRAPVGPFLAIVVVVILLGLGGIYFLITQEIKLHEAPAGQDLPADTGTANS
jgi:hypothetical protein